MQNLRQLQVHLQDYILENSPAVLPAILDTPAVSAQTRLGIYSHAYSARLLEILASDFPGLHTLLGDEGFHQLGHDYLRTHPSVYRSVRWFPSHLVCFLQNHDDYSQHPILMEMAAFEWEMQNVLDAADAQALTIADVAAIPAERWVNMRFKFHPSLRRLDFKWNVVQIWQAVEESEPMPALAETECPVPWELWRSAELQILFSSLSAPEAWAIEVARAGQSFGEICEGLCEWMDDQNAGPYAAALLKNWLEQGLIIAVTDIVIPNEL
jgi:hypothetical protein